VSRRGCGDRNRINPAEEIARVGEGTHAEFSAYALRAFYRDVADSDEVDVRQHRVFRRVNAAEMADPDHRSADGHGRLAAAVPDRHCKAGWRARYEASITNCSSFPPADGRTGPAA
jgi:hypothetical protein